MISELPSFGEHYVGDMCSGVAKSLSDVVKRFTTPFFYDEQNRLRLPHFSLASDIKFLRNLIVQRSALRQFILAGGTQNPPLATYEYPSQPNLSQYPPGTMVRLSQEDHELSIVDLEYEFRRRAHSEGFYTNIFLGLNNRHLASTINRLGTIYRVNKQRNGLFLFYGSEKSIVTRSIIGVTQLPAGTIDFERWSHDGIWGPHVFGETFYSDTFERWSRLEILEWGKAAKEKETQRITQLSPVFKPQTATN